MLTWTITYDVGTSNVSLALPVGFNIAKPVLSIGLVFKCLGPFSSTEACQIHETGPVFCNVALEKSYARSFYMDNSLLNELVSDEILMRLFFGY